MPRRTHSAGHFGFLATVAVRLDEPSQEYLRQVQCLGSTWCSRYLVLQSKKVGLIVLPTPTRLPPLMVTSVNPNFLADST